MSTDKRYDYDLFTIGAGSGGVRASRMSAAYGARVAVAEERYLGGTCVNVGCIPKKLLVYGSHFAGDFEDAAGFGWTVGERAFDWPSLIRNKDQEIARLNSIYRGLLESHGVDLFESRARVLDPHTVEVDGRKVTAANILVATGGWPTVPNVPGREHAITSNEAFHLRGDAPARGHRRRRLHRGGVRRHLQRPRRRGHPTVSRPAVHARLRHRRPEHPRRRDAQDRASTCASTPTSPASSGTAGP